MVAAKYVPKCNKKIAENAGLEYRYWVEILFRCIVWFIPVLIVGGMIFVFGKRKREKNPKISWFWTGLIYVYILAVLFMTLIYMLFSMIKLSSEQKMEDGNFVVGVSESSETHYHYAEPVGFIFRREIVFEDERLADSLSKIYDLNFHAQKTVNGDTVFVSTEYPGMEIKIIRYGYTDSTYLDTDMNYVLTSQLLNEHRCF